MHREREWRLGLYIRTDVVEVVISCLCTEALIITYLSSYINVVMIGFSTRMSAKAGSCFIGLGKSNSKEKNVLSYFWKVQICGLTIQLSQHISPSCLCRCCTNICIKH